MANSPVFNGPKKKWGTAPRQACRRRNGRVAGCNVQGRRGGHRQWHWRTLCRRWRGQGGSRSQVGNGKYRMGEHWVCIVLHIRIILFFNCDHYYCYYYTYRCILIFTHHHTWHFFLKPLVAGKRNTLSGTCCVRWNSPLIEGPVTFPF